MCCDGKNGMIYLRVSISLVAEKIVDFLRSADCALINEMNERSAEICRSVRKCFPISGASW